jgi:hypothetical protein
MNMIHATNIWLFKLLIIYVFIECGKRLDIEMDASILFFANYKYCPNFLLRWEICSLWGYL